MISLIFNAARPQSGARLCALDEIPETGAKGFTFQQDKELFMGFVVRKEGEIHGYVDFCPHVGVPLAIVPDRFLTREEDLLICASHGALFRIGDGLCVGGPCAGQRLWPWPVKVEGQDVVVA